MATKAQKSLFDIFEKEFYPKFSKEFGEIESFKPTKAKDSIYIRFANGKGGLIFSYRNKFDWYLQRGTN